MTSADAPARRRGAGRASRTGPARADSALASVAEEPFDRLASLARDLLHVDSAFVTVLSDELSSWVGYAGAELPPGAPRSLPVEESFCRLVVRDRRPLIVDDVRLEPRTADSPLLERLGLLAWAGWPVLGPDGEPLGTMCLACERPREWTVLDVRVLRTLALAATAEFALRLRVAESERDLAGAREDRDRAHELVTDAIEQAQITQVSVKGLRHELVRPLPTGAGLDLGAEYRPARGRPLGSDWYDAIEHPDGSTSLVLGGVADVGDDTLASMSQARDITRTLAFDRPGSPAEVLERVERTMAGLGLPGTAVCVVAYLGAPEPGTGRRCLRWTTAGSPAPLLRGPDGVVRVLGRSADLALGVSGAVRRTDHETLLDAGSTLVLVTDGVVDSAHERRADGLQRLAEVLGRLQHRSAQDTAGMLVEQSGAPWTGDVTVLVARTTDGSDGQPHVHQDVHADGTPTS
jgi:stage II sporulation SpoE-like protein/GAF domain-containing protein